MEYPTTLLYTQNKNADSYTLTSNYSTLMLLVGCQSDTVASQTDFTYTGQGTLETALLSQRVRMKIYKNAKSGDVVGMPWASSSGLGTVYGS